MPSTDQRAGVSCDARPVFTFGVIADVQYADIDDGSDFKNTVRRRYRNALRVLRSAVDWWNEQPIDLVVNLGDIIDGKAASGCGPGGTARCLGAVLAELGRLRCPTRLDIIGNHELYNFDRLGLSAAGLNTTDDRGSTWRAVQPAAGVRIVSLDAFDISTINGAGDPRTAAGYSYLSSRNPNDISMVGVDWTEGLEGEERRFVPYNGGVGDEQLDWLRKQLVSALTAAERVVVLSHVPLVHGCSEPSTVVWNTDEVREVLHSPRGTSETPVVACFYGHDHKGGYCRDSRGLHHVTLTAPLEVVGDEMAYAAVDLHPEFLEVRGVGTVRSWSRLEYPAMSLAQPSL